MTKEEAKKMNEIEKASWNKATEFYCTTCCTKCDDCGKNECRLHRGYREGYKAAIEDIKNQLKNGKLGDINIIR